MNTKAYKRRTPEKTSFYKIVYNYFEEYKNVYSERYENEYGYFRKIVSDVVEKYLECGILENGLARVYCHECGKDFFVAFSCKTRLFYPTCSQKRTLLWADWVNGNIFKNVPHRQWVFTIPRILRKLFYKDRKLLGKLAACVKETIEEIFNAIFRDKSYQVGAIISIQTFGDLLIWHPHIHCLVTEGVFNATGNFHPIPKIDTEKAMIIFREKVFKMLKDNNRISDTLIFKMRHWNHSGFSVNNEVYINKDNPEALERLAQYIVHSSYGNACIISSILDYSFFIESFMGGQLLSPESLQVMTTPTYMEWYFLGGEIRHSPDDEQFAHAHGTQGRGRMGVADIFHFPKSRVTICYTANLASWNFIDPLRAYDEIWDEVTYAVFVLRKLENNDHVQPPKITNEMLKRVEGNN